MQTDTIRAETGAPAPPPTWQAMRKNIRRVARAAREEAKADPEQPGQELLIAIAAALTGIEAEATEQARGARATHRRLLAAGVPPPDPEHPDAPLIATLVEIWCSALICAADVCSEIEALYAAPEGETKH